MQSMLSVVSVILCIFFGCQHREKERTASEIIVDSFPDIPFSITRPKVIVPDSLGGRNLKGEMVLEIKSDSLGSILAHKIMVLRASDGIKIEVNYRVSESPEDTGDVALFANWVEDYVEKLSLTRKYESDKHYKMGKYTILLPVRFGS